MKKFLFLYFIFASLYPMQRKYIHYMKKHDGKCPVCFKILRCAFSKGYFNITNCKRHIRQHLTPQNLITKEGGIEKIITARETIYFCNKCEGLVCRNSKKLSNDCDDHQPFDFEEMYKNVRKIPNFDEKRLLKYDHFFSNY